MRQPTPTGCAVWSLSTRLRALQGLTPGQFNVLPAAVDLARPVEVRCVRPSTAQPAVRCRPSRGGKAAHGSLNNPRWPSAPPAAPPPPSACRALRSQMFIDDTRAREQRKEETLRALYESFRPGSQRIMLPEEVR